MDHSALSTIDSAVIGERLAGARRTRRMTQQQAADAIAVARTTIVAMEKGERRPRPSELVTLAHLYSRPVAEFVRPEPAVAAPDFLVQFHAASNRRGESDAQRDDDIRRFQQLCEWYVDLETGAGAPLPRRYPPVYDVSGAPPERAADEVAASERNRLGLGDGPIGDLWGLLETDIGLRVFAIPMSDRRVTGIFLFTEEYGGCIAVNADHPEEQRRLSGVHEYAHFLADRYKPEITVVNVARKAPESERFADAFARFFLMPAAGLSRRFEAIRRAKEQPVTPGDVLALSSLYRVSFQTMTWRLEELRLLPQGTWDRLHDRGFKPAPTREFFALPTIDHDLSMVPTRYALLAVQAHEAGRLTEGELAEMLLTDRIGARERVRALTMESHAFEDGEWRLAPLDLTAAMTGVS